MLENKWKSLILGFAILFVLLPPLEAKVVWIDYYPAKNRFSLNEFARPYFYEKETPAPKPDLYDVFRLLTERQQQKKYSDNENIESKCARIFGSIYGTKQQRLLCIKNLKSKRQKNNENKSYIKDLYDSKDPFLDLTRAVDSKKDNVDLYKPRFSSDYLDVRDLRSNTSDNLRKFYRNKDDSSKYQRTLYSSDSESSSEDEKKTNKKFKLKRFQVVANEENKKKYSDTSSDDTSSVEVKKPPKRMKPQIMQYSSSDDSSTEDAQTISSSESEFEVKKPVKKKKVYNKEKDYYYLQGNRLVNPESYEDARRRLPHFMPKRFHWEEEDLPNLGYFWFNGPQGKYSYFAMRP